MEFLSFLLEALVLAVDIAALVADLHAWLKGKENRVERRAARKAGQEVPPRDRWNRRVITLTIVVVVATAALLAWKS